MRKSIIIGAAVAASLAVAGTAQADTVTTSFDGFADGSVNGQQGWKATGPYDQEVVGVDGDKALRLSNAITSGSFGDMTFSAPVTRPASEDNANNVFTNEFTVKAPDTYEPGLAVTVSPDDGQGGRMSRLRFEDSAAGVKVSFADSSFDEQSLETLDRGATHTIKFETTFVKGDDNDVVRIFIDGRQVMRGGSWENYYREWEERQPGAVDRLILRTAGTAAPATLGSGFTFDNVTSTSLHVNNPAPLNPPAPGPVGPQGSKGDTGNTGAAGSQGANGKNGTNGSNGATGADGVNGVTTIIHEYGKLTGAKMRTLRVQSIKGQKLVSVRASLRGKRLHARGRTIKVDLRGKTVGNYNVVIVAKYKTKHGKLHTVRSVRTLSIARS